MRYKLNHIEYTLEMVHNISSYSSGHIQFQIHFMDQDFRSASRSSMAKEFTANNNIRVISACSPAILSNQRDNISEIYLWGDEVMKDSLVSQYNTDQLVKDYNLINEALEDWDDNWQWSSSTVNSAVPIKVTVPPLVMPQCLTEPVAQDDRDERIEQLTKENQELKELVRRMYESESEPDEPIDPYYEPKKNPDKLDIY